MEQTYDYENFSIQRIETPPYGTNAYVFICKKTQDSLLVDAPGDPDRIFRALEKSIPKMIVITHGHFDHTGALADLNSRLNITTAAHSLDSSRLPIKIDRRIEDGDKLFIGKVELKILHTPGHTPGSICLLSQNILLSGDTLFPHGPGRTNTPDDFQNILHSLKEKVFVLPDDVLVLPGHGDPTVLKNEKEEFAIFRSRSHPSTLCGDILWFSS
jgi:glyoxylase-like metal-dependent hydrolase (beta-lactamase superfamily II)